MQKPLSVTAFVDWNSQIYNAKVDEQDPYNRAKQTMGKTTKSITNFLLDEDPSRRYDVSLRLYHGWHKGWEKTENLRAIMSVVGDPEFPAYLSRKDVVFRQIVQYGHTLMSANPHRQHKNIPIHLANTLRKRNKNREFREKMIDTAMAADLLQWARETPSNWALVMAEDDDIVPPTFTAEAWIHGHGGRVFIVRKRKKTAYLITDGLLKRLK